MYGEMSLVKAWTHLNTVWILLIFYSIFPSSFSPTSSLHPHCSILDSLCHSLCSIFDTLFPMSISCFLIPLCFPSICFPMHSIYSHTFSHYVFYAPLSFYCLYCVSNPLPALLHHPYDGYWCLIVLTHSHCFSCAITSSLDSHVLLFLLFWTIASLLLRYCIILWLM